MPNFLAIANRDSLFIGSRAFISAAVMSSGAHCLRLPAAVPDADGAFSSLSSGAALFQARSDHGENLNEFMVRSADNLTFGFAVHFPSASRTDQAATAHNSCNEVREADTRCGVAPYRSFRI